MPQFYNCDAISDQTDLIHSQSTATDIASAWTSILAYWFPPDEGYQIRLNHNDAWVEVYAMRVANRPGETEISISPLFVIRCYSTRLDAPSMPRWQLVMDEISSSVVRMCRSVNAAGHPAFGAVACSDLVLMCSFRTDGLVMEACDIWPDVYSLGLLKEPIQEFLDYVKSEFWKSWEQPYVRYHQRNGSPSSVKDEGSDAGERLSWIPEHGGWDTASEDVDAGAGVEETHSMETSSPGSSDLDTDSGREVNGTDESYHINGVNGANGFNGVNGFNVHGHLAIEHHEDSWATSADRNRDNPTEFQQALDINGYL